MRTCTTFICIDFFFWGGGSPLLVEKLNSRSWNNCRTGSIETTPESFGVNQTLREPENKQTQQSTVEENKTTEVAHLLVPRTRGADPGANGAEMQRFIPVILEIHTRWVMNNPKWIVCYRWEKNRRRNWGKPFHAVAQALTQKKNSYSGYQVNWLI